MPLPLPVRAFNRAGGALRAASAMRTSTRAGKLRPLRGGRLALPIAVASRGPLHAIDVRVTYDASALRVVRAVATGDARNALLAVNASQPGALRMAMASGQGIVTAGRPIAVVVFEALRAHRVAVPSVSIRLDAD